MIFEGPFQTFVHTFESLSTVPSLFLAQWLVASVTNRQCGQMLGIQIQHNLKSQIKLNLPPESK